MSDAKAPPKSEAGSKKTEAKKPAAEQSATAVETSPADKSSAKSDVTPKSASQSSISHFSSVSTPAYRAGWDSVFGKAKTTKKKSTRTSVGENIPDKLTISDADIDAELRNILYKAFQRQARKQGFSLSKARKLREFDYHLICDFREK